MNDATDKVASTDATVNLLMKIDPVKLQVALIMEINKSGLTWNQNDFVNKVIDRVVTNSNCK